MKRKHDQIFNEYLSFLNTDDLNTVKSFFLDFKQHMNLPLGEEKKLRNDLEKALMCYNALGVPVSEALRRLDNKNLGGFYARPPHLYYALDDAAKIYPLSMKHGSMNVFRLSAILKDDVIPSLLQIALTFTIKRFPRFATTLKKGFFWHYLDANKQRYAIEEEDHLPCRPIKVSRTGSKSFRVIYYKSRISVEFFHSLTDGRGGLVFLQTLLATYFELCGSAKLEHPNILDINATPDSREDANEFKTSTAKKASGFKQKKALQMSGKLSNALPVQILHYKMDATQLKAVAKNYGVTITNYVLALMLLSAKHATEAQKGDISIQLPVDMRQHYPSQTLANFSMYGAIRLPINQITTLEEILPIIAQQLETNVGYEQMSKMMLSAHKMNREVRLVPLVLKAPIASIGYGLMGETIFTTTLSNIGLIKAPEAFNDFIDSYDFVLGPPQVNRAANTLITFGNVSTLTITKSTRDPSYEEELYRLFLKDRIDITIEGSALYESKCGLSSKKYKKKLKT